MDNNQINTNAGALLNSMQVRKAMLDAGTIRPDEAVAKAIRILVAKLSQLNPTELIDIVILNRSPLSAQYIRTETREVLAEFELSEDSVRSSKENWEIANSPRK
ncbi:MAG: hypothetical protein HY255_11650 [Betaproteobacteria bacterium]|nr:hypothetical protein [Betaproteobacteria bacterium]